MTASYINHPAVIIVKERMKKQLRDQPALRDTLYGIAVRYENDTGLIGLFTEFAMFGLETLLKEIEEEDGYDRL